MSSTSLGQLCQDLLTYSINKLTDDSVPVSGVGITCSIHVVRYQPKSVMEASPGRDFCKKVNAETFEASIALQVPAFLHHHVGFLLGSKRDLFFGHVLSFCVSLVTDVVRSKVDTGVSALSCDFLQALLTIYYGKQVRLN